MLESSAVVGWYEVRLIDILKTLENGARPKGGVKNIEKGIPSIGGEHLDKDGGFDFTGCRYVPENFFNQQKRGIIQRQDILIVKDGATTGKVSFVGEDFPFSKSMVNEHVFILRPKKDVDPRWLFFYIYSVYGQSQIKKSFHGMIGGINTKFAEDFYLLLPPLEVQRKIVQVLDKINELKQKRQKIMEIAKELPQSIFLDMFGDPYVNPKSWKTVSVEEVIDNIRYGTSTPPIFSDSLGFPFIRATNIKFGKIVKKDLKFISKKEGDKIPKCKLEEGEVIVVRSGVNTGDSTNIDKKYHGSYAGYDIILTPNKNLILGEFLSSQFMTTFLRDQMKNLSKRSAQSHLNAAEIKSLRIILPPMELQVEFIKIKNVYEKVTDKYELTLEEYQMLFSSLLSMAMIGKLK